MCELRERGREINRQREERTLVLFHNIELEKNRREIEREKYMERDRNRDIEKRMVKERGGLKERDKHTDGQIDKPSGGQR